MEYVKDDQTVCRWCGDLIRFDGALWEHIGEAQPRHMADPPYETQDVPHSTAIQALLDRIDTAISRLSALESTASIQQSINNLQFKRKLVETGNFVVRQVNEEAVRLIGAEIASMIRMHQMGGRTLLKSQTKQR